MKKFYITTPIYYVNDIPHIGHAYTTIAADMIARFKKLDGFDVMFLTGTDEHGQKVGKSAEIAGVDPQDFVDKVSQNFKDLMPVIDAQYDVFMRTTEERHKTATQHIWKVLEANGDIYLDSYKGWYSVRDEAFYDASEIVDGKAPTGAPVEWVEEESYFFRLSKYQEPLLDYFEKNPGAIAPEGRKNEVLSFIKSGLRDLSISRTTFSWGIPVPGNAKHIMYVWLDALTNYITAAGYPEKMNFWPASLHLVGKDILRFHCVYWPAFLMSAGLPLPERVFAHGWWTAEGEKMSKSLGNVIDPVKLVDEFGADTVRYFMMREISFGNDGDFYLDNLKKRLDSDLANAWGNLVQRVLAFIAKNLDGKIDDIPQTDEEILKLSKGLINTLRQDIDSQKLHHYLEHVFELIYAANQYVDAQKPWTLRREAPKRMMEVLHVLLTLIRDIAIYLSPILTRSSKKVLEMLHIQGTTFETLQEPLNTNMTITPPEPLFQKSGV